MDVTTSLCHRYTPPEQLAQLTKNADIIVSAAGNKLYLRPQCNRLTIFQRRCSESHHQEYGEARCLRNRCRHQ